MAGRPEFLEFDDGHGTRLGALSWPGLLGAPTVVAVPDGTNSAWWFDPLAHRLAGAARLVAVDLRGRGRSLDAPGPFCIEQHADDVAALIRELDVGSVVVIGHSMGATVALLTAERHPELVEDLLLVDGGTPTGHEVDDPADLDRAVDDLLGPSLEELRAVWPDRVSYHTSWVSHPAFSGGISPDLERNLLADLVEVDGGFRVAVNPDAVLADTRDLLSNHEVATLLERRSAPVTVIRAEFGRTGRPPAFITDAVRDRHPQHRWVEGAGLDHETILLTPAGATLISDTLRSVLVDQPAER